MGIYDRDYYRNDLPRGGFGHFSAWSVTTWLIVINVVVFFVDGAIDRRASRPTPVEMEEVDHIDRPTVRDPLNRTPPLQLAIRRDWPY